MLWISLSVSLSLSFSVLLPLSFSVSLSVVAWTFLYLFQPSNQPSRSLALNHHRRFPHHRHFPLLLPRPSLLSPHVSKGREVVTDKVHFSYAWEILGKWDRVLIWIVQFVDLNFLDLYVDWICIVQFLDLILVEFIWDWVVFFILNECSFGYWARIRMAFPLLVWNVMDVCDSNF